MLAHRSSAIVVALLTANGGVQAFVPASSAPLAPAVACQAGSAVSSLSRCAFSVGRGAVVSRDFASPSSLPLRSRRGNDRTLARMTSSDSKLAGFVTSNVGALASGAGFAAGASAISEISPHAAAFVQLVCLSIWLGMSVYATFVWPVITGINMRDSSEFASLLSKLAPSYLQLSAAMIMSLGTSSVVIGHANAVQLYILGVALVLTLYNAIILEPTAVVAFEESREAERRMRGKKTNSVNDEDLPRKQAELANFVGAEVLLDLLSILCAVSYAWDLASTISFAS